ncbi:alpha/beta hydrolase [Aestuariivirga sp.]|jgi:pimeloyl-ACP methyl ester carboxylesterase|uniref:alpha/beta hydrolase n=1 Tax=Aestuariivirga sp. TaxID=2650926 RepID=UPI003784D766
MMSLLRSMLFVGAAAYLGILLYMYVQQRSLQYFPSHQGITPEALGLTGVSEERVKTPDGETIVLWHAGARPGYPTILFFHGNGGEVAGRAERMAFYQSQGFGALFVSYRGYGASTGNISEQGFITDALTAYDFLAARGLEAKDIVLVGESLGTGVAVQLAAMRPVGAMVLEAPFTAAVDVAAEIYPWLPVRLLMKDQFRSRDVIGKVTAPLLIIHGDADRIIPVAHGRKLHELANEPKELVILPGASHDMIADSQVWAREAAFLLRAVR